MMNNTNREEVDRMIKKLAEKWNLDNTDGLPQESIAELYECEAGKLLREEMEKEELFDNGMRFNEVHGDLISLALRGEFDVITHGCNCMSNMGAGIAVPMNFAFDVSLFPMEQTGVDINKLGNIDYRGFKFIQGNLAPAGYDDEVTLTVINSYTQYVPSVKMKPLDYEALTLCLRKINKLFNGKHIGLPQIGAGLAGGDWKRIKQIIQTELDSMHVTIVYFKPNMK